ncbi:MAG: VOC family protein [Hyphomicrobiales bacterium]|nr:VOC family protein [Hyphomicrobiales bacterium]
MKLSSTRIVTKDVTGLAQFYEKVTGIPPAGNADFVEFRTSGSILALCSQRAVNAHNVGAATPAANRSAILEFQVEDVDAERSRLQSAVREWVQEPTDQPWGNRSMLFRDPDGNLINFFTPVRR